MMTQSSFVCELVRSPSVSSWMHRYWFTARSALFKLGDLNLLMSCKEILSISLKYFLPYGCIEVLQASPNVNITYSEDEDTFL